jgi:LysM repeat protein
MFKKLSTIIILALAALLLLVSCQRAASQAPVPSLVAPTGSIASAESQSTPLSKIEIIQTTTAMYAPTESVTPELSQPTSPAVGTGTLPNSITLITPTGATTATPAAGYTPVVIMPIPTIGRPATYTLNSGEYPYCIARRFNVNQDELMTLNGLSSASLLQPGMVLNIPQSGNSFVGERALHPHPDTYTVSSADDTIYRVACYFGDVDPTQIIAANGLSSPYTLHINQVLNIP